MNAEEEAAARQAIRSVLQEVVPAILADAKAENALKTTPATPPAATRTPTPAPTRQGSFAAPSASDSPKAASQPPRAPVNTSSKRSQPQPGTFTASTTQRIASAPEPTSDSGVIPVTIDNDRDLAAFVFEVMHQAENVRRRDDIRAGRLTFKLANTIGNGTPTPGAANHVRVDKGALTDRMVQSAAGSGRGFIVGRGASITPLAAESARSLGVTIERER